MSDPFFSPDDASRTTSVSTYLQGRNHGTWLIAHQGVCDAANAAFAPTVGEPMAVATAIIRAVFSRVFISPPCEAATIRHLSKQAVKFTFNPDHLMELECPPAAWASRQVDDPHDPRGWNVARRRLSSEPFGAPDVDSIPAPGCRRIYCNVLRRPLVKKKFWKRPEVKRMIAGRAETSGGSAQEGGTGPATHAS
jgi:hypothetical protein